MPRMPNEPPDESLYRYIPREYAAEIAYVISGWAHLEYDMDVTIWELAGLGNDWNIGACLTAQFSTVHARINALIALARVRSIPDTLIAKLNKFRELAGALGERRNRIAHDPWFVSYGKLSEQPRELKGMYRLQRTARAKLEHAYKPVALEELKALRAEIEDCVVKFNHLSSEIVHAFWSSPEKPQKAP